MVANNYLLSHLFVKIIFHGYLGCADAGGASASAAIDALRSSAHPMDSIFCANNQVHNTLNKQFFSIV
jgi:hypothetical protein